MRDHGIWSLSLGRYNGVQLRLHMFFLVFAAFTLHLSWLDALEPASDGQSWLGMVALGILLVSVVIHELGHVLAANRLGASFDEIVLGPLGGLGAGPTGNVDPQSELVIYAAGPLANLGVCCSAAFSLALHGGVDLVGLLNPLTPTEILVGPPLLIGIKLTFWINWLLLLLNMIPAYPFDGARVLRASLMSFRGMDHARAVHLAARIAKVTAVGLLVLAWLMFNDQTTYRIQVWFALVLMAMFVYFSAKKEEAALVQAQSEDAFLGYDFSAGYTSLERSGPGCSTKTAKGPIIRWLHRRRALRDQRRREIEVIEDGRVDQILTQVHENGMESLSREDRELLQRVSARYRNRSAH